MTIRFEKLTAPYKSIILEWFSQPHVLEFFYGDGLQNTLNNLDLYCQGINHNGRYTFDDWIAFHDDVPFGFLITSVIEGSFDATNDYKKWFVKDKKTMTLDLLIGSTKYLGKGFSSRMIESFIMTQFPDVDYFIIDPEVANKKAIHVYQKVGFRKIAEFAPDFNPRPHMMLRLVVDELKRKVISKNITTTLAKTLIANQFPEYAHLPITSVKKQGHDNRTFRLGDNLLIRMPTAEAYALKVPKEQALLLRLKPYLTVAIPEPIKMGHPSSDYPFPFSIYKWLESESANALSIEAQHLEKIALQLASFLKELQNIKNVEGPEPGQHNWWRGDHVHVYDDGARKQIIELHNVIDSDQAIKLWDQACETEWKHKPVWIHGDVSSGNILIKNQMLAGVIDFGGMGVGDPACDLVIAWTFFQGKSREKFIEAMTMDSDTWLRAKAWVLWKATYELCQIQDKSSDTAVIQKKIIDEILK